MPDDNALRERAESLASDLGLCLGIEVDMLQAALAAERKLALEEAKNEGWLRHSSGCSADWGYACRCGLWRELSEEPKP